MKISEEIKKAIKTEAESFKKNLAETEGINEYVAKAETR